MLLSLRGQPTRVTPAPSAHKHLPTFSGSHYGPGASDLRGSRISAGDDNADHHGVGMDRSRATRRCRLRPEPVTSTLRGPNGMNPPRSDSRQFASAFPTSRRAPRLRASIRQNGHPAHIYDSPFTDGAQRAATPYRPAMAISSEQSSTSSAVSAPFSFASSIKPDTPHRRSPGAGAISVIDGFCKPQEFHTDA